MKTKKVLGSTNVLKRCLMGILITMFSHSILTPVFAHNASVWHERSPLEKFIQKYGAGHIGMYNRLTPAEKRKFDSDQANHVRQFNMAQAKKRAKAKREADIPRRRENTRIRAAALNKMVEIAQSPTQGCVSCHALPTSLSSGRATTSEMGQVARVVRNHRSTEYPAPGTAQCSDCHQTGWHAPASNMDFRNKTKYQVCIMLNTPTPSRPSIRGHLLTDPLIRWAVGGVAHPTLPPGTRSPRRSRWPEWNREVNNWLTATDGWRTAAQKCSYLRAG